MGYGGYGWRPYVSVAERQRKAAREMEKRKKKGQLVSPVIVEGRTIVETFMLMRPTWSDPTARSTLRQNAANRIAQFQGKQPQ